MVLLLEEERFDEPPMRRLVLLLLELLLGEVAVERLLDEPRLVLPTLDEELLLPVTLLPREELVPRRVVVLRLPTRSSLGETPPRLPLVEPLTSGVPPGRPPAGVVVVVVGLPVGRPLVTTVLPGRADEPPAWLTLPLEPVEAPATGRETMAAPRSLVREPLLLPPRRSL